MSIDNNATGTAGLGTELEQTLAKLSNLEQEFNSAVSRIIELEAQLNISRQNHQKDIETIGNELIEMAQEFNWCSTYDEKIDDVNNHLFHPLPSRYKDFSIRGTIILRFGLIETLERNATETMALTHLFDLDIMDIINRGVDIYSRDFQNIELEEY